MTTKEKRKHCSGCEDNFYNGNNPLGVKECWMLSDMKLIKRKEVGINDRPPWTWKSKKYPNCYERRGYVYINCENGDRVR